MTSHAPTPVVHAHSKRRPRPRRRAPTASTVGPARTSNVASCRSTTRTKRSSRRGGRSASPAAHVERERGVGRGRAVAIRRRQQGERRAPAKRPRPRMRRRAAASFKARRRRRTVDARCLLGETTRRLEKERSCGGVERRRWNNAEDLLFSSARTPRRSRRDFGERRDRSRRRPVAAALASSRASLARRRPGLGRGRRGRRAARRRPESTGRRSAPGRTTTSARAWVCPVWKSSETCLDLREPPRHRADCFTAWDDVASMASMWRTPSQ